MTQRVQKILSQWGIASRRKAEQLILEGRVKVNGIVVKLGQVADPNSDRIEVDGRTLNPHNKPKLEYILINKPVGVVCTCFDPQGRRTVLDLLPSSLRHHHGLHPVGRLDFNSSGALLLTNDGDLTLQLTHPRYHLPKTYQVSLQGYLSSENLKQWREGLVLEGKKTLPAVIKVLKSDKNHTLIQITLKEGRNRQIRKIAAQFGLEVQTLHRTAIGFLTLQSSPEGSLLRGQVRRLSSTEIKTLKQMVDPFQLKLKSVVSE